MQKHVWTEIEISGFSLYAQSQLWTLSKLFDWMINIEAAATNTYTNTIILFGKISSDWLNNVQRQKLVFDCQQTNMFSVGLMYIVLFHEHLVKYAVAIQCFFLKLWRTRWKWFYKEFLMIHDNNYKDQIWLISFQSLK